MKITNKNGQTQILFDNIDEGFLWQVLAARLRESSGATLRDEFIKTAEEMARLAQALRSEGIARRRPNGEVWTTRIGEDGCLRIEIATTGELGG